MSPGGEMESCSESVTELLHQLKAGTQEAENKLFTVVYPELRRIASRYMYQERSDHTLQTTALINEAYLRLVDQREKGWQNRAHFFAFAARVMRRILVDYARQNRTEKRGGLGHKVPLDGVLLIRSTDSDDLLALDEALSRLAEWDPRQSRTVELRFFGGLTEEETASVLGVTRRTVNRDWSMAKAWLYGEIAKRAIP